MRQSIKSAMQSMEQALLEINRKILRFRTIEQRDGELGYAALTTLAELVTQKKDLDEIIAKLDKFIVDNDIDY